MFPKGMFSCLAGFMEPGETVEESVRRETFEESGVRVGKITYHSSQPWPYPSQIMLAMIGEALTEEIVVDKTELEEAKWFSIEEVKQGIFTSFIVLILKRWKCRKNSQKIWKNFGT